MPEKGKRKRIIVISLLAFVCLVLAAVLVLAKYSNAIVKSGIESALGKDFSIGSIELKWGSVEVSNLVMKNKAGREIVKAENLIVKANFMSLLRKEYIISSVLVKNPYMYVEVDEKGNLASPVFPTDEKKTGKEKKKEEGKKKEGKKADIPAAAPVVFKKIVVVGGSVDYLDRKSPRPPVLTKVRDINLEMNDITVPFADNFTRYIVTASVPAEHGKASVKSDGKIRPGNKDLECRATVRGLDITHFKPYLHTSESASVARGFLDLDITAKIVSNRINAPGKAVIKDLEFKSGQGLGSKFMGVPVSLVVSFLKEKGGQIPVDFVISGDLDSPKFNITEDFKRKLAIGIAAKLGFSIIDVGKSVFGVGTEGTQKTGEGVMGIGGGLKKIFGK